MKNILTVTLIILASLLGLSHTMSHLFIDDYQKKIIHNSQQTDEINDEELFKETFENATHWQYTFRTSRNNKWAIGNAVYKSGSKSLYISNDNGQTHNFDIAQLSTVATASKIFSIPSGITQANLSFDWHCKGLENTIYFRVWIVPETYTPQVGLSIENDPNAAEIAKAVFYQNGSPYFSESSAWKTHSSTIDLSSFTSGKAKLLFEWIDSWKTGVAPPAAIDNILIKKTTADSTENCIAPTNISSSNITTNSAQLNWQSNQNLFSYYLSTTNQLGASATSQVQQTSTILTNLQAATTYYFWVKAICSESNNSSWEGPYSFTTLQENTLCSKAKEIPVSATAQCSSFIEGKLSDSAIASFELPNCNQVPIVKELWYKFKATNTTHIIKLNPENTTFTALNIAVYKDNICTVNSEALLCEQYTPDEIFKLNHLEIGKKYKVRIYTTASSHNQTPYKLCVVTPKVIFVDANKFSKEKLVNGFFIKNSCSALSNINIRTGTDYNTLNGVGYFNKNNSDFIFKEGVVLTTGALENVPGPNSLPVEMPEPPLELWKGDEELQNEIKKTVNYTMYGDFMNASVMEFDFIAVNPKISFDYLFASEEYGPAQCSNLDAFVILLTDLQTKEQKNIALVPTSKAPVCIQTIRDKKYAGENSNPSLGADYCKSNNEKYFDTYSPGGNDTESLKNPINFRGQTKVLNAQSQVIVGRKYHIKFAIANGQGSVRLNSAVFLKPVVFEPEQINLGPDRTIKNKNALCYGTSYEIQSHLSENSYDFEWKKNGIVIENQKLSTLKTLAEGTYQLNATIKGTNCTVSKQIKIEYYPEIKINKPENINLCVSENNFPAIDLKKHLEKNIENTSDYHIEFYKKQEDAQNNTNALLNIENYKPNAPRQTIFVRYTSKESGCFTTNFFEIKISKTIKIAANDTIEVCKRYILPELQKNFYYSKEQSGKGTTLEANTELPIGKHHIYIHAQNQEGCISTKKQTIIVHDCFIPKGISPNNDGINDVLDLTHFQVLKIKIYNRYGKEVYTHAKGYTNQWYGQSSNGQKLVDGTYFYEILTLNEKFSGYIELIY